MKKTLLTACAMLCVAGALAQPTLTASGINPVVGDQFVNVGGPWMSPGNAGAGQTWNLSGLSNGSTSTQTVVAVSSTSYSASFTNSNLGITSNGTSFEYYNANSSAYQSFGSGSASSVDSYANAEDRLRFPFTYNNSYTDNFNSVYTSGTNTVYRIGTTTVTADGYGTLVTPAGTFNNVLRIHSVMGFHDSTNTGGNPSVTVYQRDQYLWYLNGNHTALANVGTFTIVPAGGSAINSQSAGYLGNPSTGIADAVTGNAVFSVYPNPAANQLYISLTGSEPLRAALFDMLGNLTETASIQGGSAYSMDVSRLPEGSYFLQVTFANGTRQTRKVVITR